MKRIKWIGAAPLLVSLLAAAPAFGATANVTNFNNKVTAIYEAGPGEVNHVTATVSSGAVTFTDPGKNMAAGTGCTTPGTNTITCRHDPPIEAIRISLGDEADFAKNDTALPSVIHGGDLPGDLGDTLIGGSGPDVLLGHNGNDTLTGNGDNDELHGEGNNDTLFGNAGNDDLTGDDQGDPAGANNLSGGIGNDTLIASENKISGFNQNVDGGDGNDFIQGAGGADTLNGGNGIDHLDPSEDNDADVVNGGADKDTVDYFTDNTNWAVTVSLDNIANDGPKSLTKNDNIKSDIEVVWGSPLDDLLIGTAGPQTLIGFGSDDTLDGGTGPDILTGGGGAGDTATYESRATPVTATIDGVANDGVVGENDNVKTDIENLRGGKHNDSLTGDGDTNHLFGDDGGDTLNGVGGDDTLNGEGSNDTFISNPGVDTMNGGAGFDTADYSARVGPQTITLDDQPNDGSNGEGDNVRTEQVFGGSNDDQITGDSEGNSLEGRGGADTLIGGGNADSFTGGLGGDTIQGGDGDDVILNSSSADGADIVGGGPGSDLSNYSSRTNPLNVSLNDVADDGEAGENDNVKTTVERVFGGSAPDGLQGSAEDNLLAGGGGGDTVAGTAGDDTIKGDAGVDSLFGGDDHDVIEGGGGADSMAGGPGPDAADYSGALAGIHVTIDDVANDGIPAEGDNVMTTIENVIGGRFNDNIDGNDNPNTLFGGLGTDTLRGFGEADVIAGGKGSDELRGGNGPDELHAIDSTQDSLFCGANTDGYAADNIDTVNADCENAIP